MIGKTRVGSVSAFRTNGIMVRMSASFFTPQGAAIQLPALTDLLPGLSHPDDVGNRS